MRIIYLTHFVSENPKDFADDEKKGLHPQLIEEMERLEIDPQSLVYFYNFKAFVDKVIKPELEKSGQQGRIAAELFIENETSSNEIYKRIREFVNTVDIGYYDVLFPGEYSKLTFFEPGIYCNPYFLILWIGNSGYLYQFSAFYHSILFCQIFNIP